MCCCVQFNRMPERAALATDVVMVLACNLACELLDHLVPGMPQMLTCFHQQGILSHLSKPCSGVYHAFDGLWWLPVYSLEILIVLSDSQNTAPMCHEWQMWSKHASYQFRLTVWLLHRAHSYCWLLSPQSSSQ